MSSSSSSANKYGILIDYEFCTDCHTCEVACQREHGFAPGEWDVRVLEYGPVQLSEDKWEWTYLPLLTSRCDLCAERVEMGKLPTCVHHCQSGIMYYGTLEELSQKLAEKPNQILYSH